MKRNSLLSRILMLSITSFVAVSLLAGCKKPEKTKPAVDDSTLPPLEVSYLYNDNASWPMKSDWAVIKEIEKKFNVKLVLQSTPASEYNQKRDIVLNSGTIPDLVPQTWANQVGDYAANGVILPISDYLDQMPNLKKKIVDWKLEPEIEDLKEKDGKFYVVPGFNEILSQSISMFIRTDIFKKNSIAIPKTYDEMYTALKKLKEIYPDSYPMTNYNKDDLLLCNISRSFGTNAGYSLPSGYTYDWNKKEWYFAPTSDNFKKMLEYVAKLHKEKLLDPEALTQDANAWKQKLYTGKSFVSFAWFGRQADNVEGKKLSGADFELKEILPLAGPTGLVGVKSTSRYSTGLCIPASVAKDKEKLRRLLKFVDQLYYSDEGIELASWGISGTTYTKKDGAYDRPEQFIQFNHPNAKVDVTKDYGFGGNYNFRINSPFYKDLGKDPERLAYDEALAKNNWIPKDDPGLKFSVAQKEQEKLLVAKVKDYYKQGMYEFILGKKDVNKDWDAYVKECEAKGSKELVDLVNKVWKDQQPKK